MEGGREGGREGGEGSPPLDECHQKEVIIMYHFLSVFASYSCSLYRLSQVETTCGR